MDKEAHGSHNPNPTNKATVVTVGSHRTLDSRHTIQLPTKAKVMANHNSGTILAKARRDKSPTLQTIPMPT
eukprot:5457452-Amphidinium_carterae.1